MVADRVWRLAVSCDSGIADDVEEKEMTDQSDQSDEDVMWPIGCIKPGTCERKGECSYQPCPHESKDITSEIRRAASALAKPVITEDDGTREPVPEGWQPSTFNQSKPDLPDGDGLRTPAELELLAFNAIHVEAEKHWLAYLGADRHTAVVPPKDRLEYWIAAVAIAVTRKSPTRDGAEGAGEEVSDFDVAILEIMRSTINTAAFKALTVTNWNGLGIERPTYSAILFARKILSLAPPKPAPEPPCPGCEGQGYMHYGDCKQPAPDAVTARKAYSNWAFYKEGEAIGYMLPHLAAREAFFAGAKWWAALAAPVPSPDGKCPDCGKSLHDDDEPHQLDCENRPSPAVADAFETLIDQIAKIRDEYKDSRRNHLDQMELLVAQGDAKETSYRSTEAERDGAALHAVNRVLKILETIGYASPTVRGDREIPPVKRIECVKMVDCLEVEAEPLWRLEIGGICADFETETGANNFRNAILSLPVQPATRPDSAPEKRDTEPKIG